MPRDIFSSGLSNHRSRVIDILTVEAVPTETEMAPEARDARKEARDFGRVYADHSRSIYYLALRYVGNSAQAEDIVHDVFLKAFRSLDQFRGQSSPRTWLYRIAINHCKNVRQSWHSRKIHCTGDMETLERGSKDVGSPRRELEIKELGRRIQATLDSLSEEYRLLLLLVADEALSYAEIAEVTEQSVDAVRGKLHRARKAFATEFEHTAT